jgi:hypothetical protein
MALPAMIQKAAENQTARYAALSQSLANLGQQVGATLAQREYQRQAAEALPAMQESYRNAFGKIQQGDISGGYMDVLNTSMQFGATQNPFLMGYIEQANKFAKEAGDATLSQGWQNIQRGGAAGAAMGGGFPGAEGYTPPMEDAEYLDQRLIEEGGVDLETPLPDWETTEEQPRIPSQFDVIEQMRWLAKGETNKKLATALNKAADSAADPEKAPLIQAVQDSVMRFNALNNEEQSQLFALQAKKNLGDVRVFDPKKAENRNSKLIPNADKIIGNGVKGIYFNPGFVESRISKTGVTYTKQNINDMIKSVDAGISKLNEGGMGKFITKSGGVYNVGIETVMLPPARRGEEEQEALKLTNNQGQEYIVKGKNEIASVRIAYNDVKSIPAQMQNFQESDIGFLVSKTFAEGPTAGRAQGMPALQQSAPARQPNFQEGKVYQQGGKKYRYTQGKFVAID